MESSPPQAAMQRTIKSKVKHLVSRLLSRFEPANSGYERRIKALENQIKNLITQPQQHDGIEDKIYKEFELNFRGSSTMITNRLKDRYSSLLNEQFERSEGAPPTLLDLGCGHGEFLDIASEIGFKTIGVDQSNEAIAICKGKGHRMILGDLLSALQSFQEGSIQFISFQHVIEHCPADYTIKVFDEAKRRLVEGGAFLVETPSLLSLWASTRQFYLDPSHLRPVHPDYIQFIAGTCGFTYGEVKEFGKVEHPDACNFEKIISSLNDEGAAQELKKLDKWLYGPMDLCCIFKK